MSKGSLSPEWLEKLSHKELFIVQKQLIETMEVEAKAKESSYKEMEKKAKLRNK